MRALREEVRVGDEQLASLVEDADEARLRALVSETPLAEQDHRSAQRHADAMSRVQASLRVELTRLEGIQDELLDRLAAESRRA